MKTFLICALSFLPILPLATAEEAILTNKKGMTLKVILKSATAEEVTFNNLGDGKKYTVKLADLDDSSKALVTNWLGTTGAFSWDLRLRPQVVRANKKSKIENYDDRHVRMAPKITISNKSSTKPTDKMTVTMIILGRPVGGHYTNSDLTVLAKQTKNLPSIPRVRDREVVFDEFHFYYDNKNAARFGSKYLGYVFLVEKDGKLIERAVNPSFMRDKDIDKIKAMRSGHKYDKDLDPK